MPECARLHRFSDNPKGKLLMGCVRGMVEVDLKSRAHGKGDFAVTYHQYKLDNPKRSLR